MRSRPSRSVARTGSIASRQASSSPVGRGPLGANRSSGVVETPGGRAGFAFVPRNEYGVLDHYVTPPSGDVVYNPMRVIADGQGCEAVFTLRRPPGMSDEEFGADAGAVAADLARLKQVLEDAR